MTKKLTITMEDDLHVEVSIFAETKGIEISDAISSLLRTAIGRRAAVNAWAARQAAANKKEKKAAKPKAAKAAKVKAAPKAKAPRAPKAAKAPKAKAVAKKAVKAAPEKPAKKVLLAKKLPPKPAKAKQPPKVADLPVAIESAPEPTVELPN